MSSKVADLAAVGGLFLLAFVLGPILGGGGQPIDAVTGGDVALLLGLAVAVGAAITMYVTPITDVFLWYGLAQPDIVALMPEEFARARVIRPQELDRHARVLTTYHVILHLDEPTRTFIEKTTEAAAALINGAFALTLGLVASYTAFGLPAGPGWLVTFGVTFIVVSTIGSAIGDRGLLRDLIKMELAPSEGD